MQCFLVSHTHWDREWYRTFEEFRARLVDVVDRVLDLTAADPGFGFLLDGQTIAIEDYLQVRPNRCRELEDACRSGRISIGPWYVQPDSLLPSGEAHVRNLLEGRRTAEAIGPVSTVAYVPDSFGHPAQFPQLFGGFGLEPFVYWRGNGSEIDELPAEYLWEAPDGSTVLAHNLWLGYFAASVLPADPAAAAAALQAVGRDLARRARNDRILLMNGVDHTAPDAHTAAVCEALAGATGWTVKRALLEDFARGLPRAVPRFRGELLGGRVAPLLPGVWSARLPLKLRNRRAETLLEAWAEPWCTLGRMFGTADERPSLRAAWRSLLQNQAHDSIGGCSQDHVHEQMDARYDTAEELARETTTRVLERLAGLGLERRTPWKEEIDLAVFNPSPHPRTDVVCFPLDPRPPFEIRTGPEMALHPLLLAGATAPGFTADERAARLISDTATGRMRLLPESTPRSVEFVARDVPALGWRRIRLRSSESHPEVEDEGREIATDSLSVSAAGDGTFTLRFGARTYSGLGAIEDAGDRGDTYDFDPAGDGTITLEKVRRRRAVHPSGIQRLEVVRTFLIPRELAPDRRQRSSERVPLVLAIEARVCAGIERLDLRVQVDNEAKDHRLRLLFPTGEPASEFFAATTFEIARRQTAPQDTRDWVHPAPRTFPHQGLVSANGLTVVAPGLPEAEVTPEGIIAVTLLRAVGWLARMDLESRAQPAGPAMPAPGAQCLGTLQARISLLAGLDPRAARDAETGMWAVTAGDRPLVPPEHALLSVSPREVILSALKPAEGGRGTVLRLLNPTAAPADACVSLGFPVARGVPLRLDETPADFPIALEGNTLSLPVPPHALRSVLLIARKAKARRKGSTEPHP